MTLSREEYITRAADAYLEKRWGSFWSMANEEQRAEATERVSAALDAVGAYETYEALGDTLDWIDEVGAEAKRRDTERLAPARAAISKAEGTEDQRG